MRALSLLLIVVGCSGETTARVTIRPGSAMPASLRIHLWGDGLLRPVVDLPLSGRALPGTMIIRHLDPNTPDFRLLVDGLDAAASITSEGGQHVVLQKDHEAEVTIQLVDGTLADSDGDDVPDVVDDCATVSDPDQRCAAPSHDLGGDLGARDLSAVSLPDLAGADLAGRDLATTHDMSQPSNHDMSRHITCPAGALFCDDFESGSFDGGTRWGPIYSEGGGSTVAVDNSLAFSGSYSAHVIASGGLVLAPHTFAPVSTGGMLAFRAMFYNGPALMPSAYFFWLHRPWGSPTVDEDYVIGYDNFSQCCQWTLFDKNLGTPYNVAGSTAEDTWHCLELDISFNPDGSNTLEYFVDGNAATPVTVPSPQAAPNLGELDIGVSYQSGATSNKVHIDDVVLHTQHIGCE